MIGQTISHYNILEKLGEGGMGVVYKAHDVKLDRTIALKFLPQAMAASEADRARFLQEARAAASLDNANICTIFGIEEYQPADSSGGGSAQLFIAMAYVEGTTLREKLSAITQKQAIDIAIQVADGLAAAHEKGVVHRDIKPENIMVRKDGVAQIMDFGLAKLRENSSKINRLTKQGSTVGTAGYMSPEQVQGMDADHRSDIFSFGVLLYELLTGQLPFRGVHETALAYEIVNVDPAPMSSVNAGIDPSLDAIVLECLEKDVNERAQSVKQVAVDLKKYKRESSRQKVSRITAARPAMQQGAAASGMVPAGGSQVATGYRAVGVPSGFGPTPSGVAEVPVTGGKRTKLYPVIASISTVLALVFLVLWGPWNRDDSATSVITRTMIELERPYELNMNFFGSPIDISPDGKLVAYSGFDRDSGRVSLFLRSLDNFTSTPLPGAYPREIKFSPDGQWIYYSAGGSLLRVSINGGAPVRVSNVQNPRGMCFGPDGSIFLATGQVGGIVKVIDGDSVESVATPNRELGEISLRFPDVLPAGKGMIMTAKYKTTATFDDAAILVQDLSTGERKTLIEGGSYASYVPTGHIVYVRGGSMFAAPFDESSLSVTGPTRQLFPGGMINEESGSAAYAFSQNGTLVFAPGGPSPTQSYSVDWISLKGEVTPLMKTPSSYGGLALSPDRTKLALTLFAANNDIWTYDITRATMQRLTFGGANHSDPTWTPDGKRVAYFAEREEFEICWRPWDGSGKEEKLIGEKGHFLRPACFTPDGKTMLFLREDRGNYDLWALSTDSLGKPWRVGDGLTNIFEVQLSPNGRWLMYKSAESGKPETYVVPYPHGEGRWQVTSGGSWDHYWNRDGGEILYFFADKLFSVPVKNGASLEPGTPRQIADLTAAPIVTASSFDPAGMRWAVIREAEGAHAPTTVNIITGWFDELRAMKSGTKE